MNRKSPQLIAFYLPQFHPIPENDAWWGKGFTEWTNTTKAKPLFSDHYQPHLPTDLGFYDLRVPETRHDQIKLAKQYGIDGFCYYYYWFSGKRLLNRPLDDMLSDKDSDMPFCLCWANENWTRRWDGAENEMLIEQKFLPEDNINFIKDITAFLLDPRYIKIDGAPLLIIYRPQLLPNLQETASIWRDYCKSVGIPKIHLCVTLTHEDNENYETLGFDSAIEFPPHGSGAVKSHPYYFDFNQKFEGRVNEYSEFANFYLEKTYVSQKIFKCVCPSWDNTARVNNRATMLVNSTPNNYEFWLSETIKKLKDDGNPSDNIVFINAWNEWAEGCHLEPDRLHGRGFLEATLRAKQGLSTITGFQKIVFPSVWDENTRSLPNDLKNVFSYYWTIILKSVRLWIARHPHIRKSGQWIKRIIGMK